MSTVSEDIWRAKLAAWLHDPGEKALVLFRRFREGGHEGGNVKRLGELLFGESAADVFIKEADHWAAAADRPQMEFKEAGRADVRFGSKGSLIHPLCGTQADLGELALDGDDLQHIEDRVFAEAIALVEAVMDGDRTPETPEEWRKVMLALWRFLPDVAYAPEGIGHLWRLLPADSRVPDHAIWTHLDLASALAGAFAADPNEEVALMMVALGPVQDFIAQARSTSDLWAGSHLLSHLALAAMKPVIEELGPDAVIFPHLRGVPLVDVWLMQDMGLERLFDENKVEWRRQKTDFNPLFMAALPNLFLAIVPRSRAEALAKKAEEAARDAMAEVANKALGRLLDAANDKAKGDPEVAGEQLKAQIAGFPEAYWAVAPWAKRSDDYQAARQRLLDILKHFADSDLPGIFDHKGFKALERAFGEGVFKFRPNPGVLYPAAHEAVGKVMGATKTLRPFDQLEQEGFRCTLCGEREWLTLDRRQLHFTRNQREDNADKGDHTLWTAIDNKPSWAKNGEHLCAVCASKRLWPTLFMEQVSEMLPENARAQRFVVSTHALALADNLMDIAQDADRQRQFLEAWQKYESAFPEDARPVALPKRLADALNRIPDIARNLKKVPEIIENTRGTDEEDQLESFLQEAGLSEREKYYAVLLMDGDKMGAWISGENAITFAEAFHPEILKKARELAQTDRTIRAYLDAPRPASPARHVSISAALNGFALDLVRVVVEELCNGKLIYAGGDDVLAMLTVEDALKAALALRLLYSGHEPDGIADAWLPDRFRQTFEVHNGYVLHKHRNRLYMTMGPTATASAGLVIAHAMTPLSRVLAEARRAEKLAKNSGRNALAITVMKRSGNVATAVGQWPEFSVKNGEVREETPLGATFPGLLADLAARMRAGELSRRAPYHMFQRLQLLPPRKLSGLEKNSWDEMLASTLAYQFERQCTSGKGDKATLRDLARRIADWVCKDEHDDPLLTLREFLGVAEFLGRRDRETERPDEPDETPDQPLENKEAAE